MLDVILQKINKHYEITERDIGNYSRIDKIGFHVDIKAYVAEGCGNFSTLTATGMAGIMKMETLVFTPLYVDGPLFSFDRITIMGTDSWYVEFYDTRLNDVGDFEQLNDVKAKTFDMPNFDLGQHWYDYMKMPFSVAKKGKRSYFEERFTNLTVEYASAYLRLLRHIPYCDPEEKRLKQCEYVDGLFQNGGPSTDTFCKMLGRDKAYDLFTKYIFSSKPE